MSLLDLLTSSEAVGLAASASLLAVALRVGSARDVLRWGVEARRLREAELRRLDALALSVLAERDARAPTPAPSPTTSTHRAVNVSCHGCGAGVSGPSCRYCGRLHVPVEGPTRPIPARPFLPDPARPGGDRSSALLTPDPRHTSRGPVV